MLAQLPFEIVDHVVEYLDFPDLRSIARVCSTFRLPAQLRLFRTIFIGSDSSEYYPDPIGSILSSPHLLQYASHLIVHNYDLKQRPSRQPWLPHLPIMYRLSTMTILLEPSDCSRVLSALESLGSAREIALIFDCRPHPDMLISDNPLPVHSLDLYVCASSHQVVQRLIQKCSQSLRKLVLRHQYSVIAPSTFLPHLYDLSVYTVKGSELMSWLPFLDQHPTITRLLLDYEFTLTVQPSPNLLPNLQFLSATPAIIERLIPGRPVDDVCGVHYPPLYPFPVDAMLRPLRQPFVPVTTVTIDTEWSLLPNDFLVNIVQTLPKLRKFTLKWTCDEVSVALQGLLPALGRCKDMVHIRIHSSDNPRGQIGPEWSRGDYIQMVQRVQENGAAGLWSFELQVGSFYRPKVCEAMRIGWLDVPQQPTLKGEWRFDISTGSSDSDISISPRITTCLTAFGMLPT